MGAWLTCLIHCSGWCVGNALQRGKNRTCRSMYCLLFTGVFLFKLTRASDGGCSLPSVIDSCGKTEISGCFPFFLFLHCPNPWFFQLCVLKSPPPLQLGARGAH